MLIVKTGLNYSWNFYTGMVWEMFFADVFILSRLQELNNELFGLGSPFTFLGLCFFTCKLGRQFLPARERLWFCGCKCLSQRFHMQLTSSSKPRRQKKKKKKDAIRRLNAKGIMQLAKDLDHTTWESNCSTYKCLLS